MKLYPLKFEPILKPLIWGGNRIAEFKGEALGDSHIGESWEVSGYPGDVSVVSEGELKGKNLNELMEIFGKDLVGSKVDPAVPFPLLFKFIDANSDLSVQVHPDDAIAQKRGERYGKTEMWYVVGTEPGAGLYSGFSKPVTREEYPALAASGEIMDRLGRYSVEKGDVFFLPAGRVHAIGTGCFIAEIQQTSNTTYRLYDYGRLGLDGKPRQLHVEEALDAIDFSVTPNAKEHPEVHPGERTLLAECRYFSTSLYQSEVPVEVDLHGRDSFTVLMCTAGSLEVEAGIVAGEASDSSSCVGCGPTKGHRVSLRQGESLLLPATTRSLKLLPSPSASVLEVHIP